MIDSEYKISSRAEARLEAYVHDLEVHPRGKLVGPVDFSDRQVLDRREIENALPYSLTFEDYAGILQLALYTECATDSYAAIFYESGKTYGANWLSRFTERLWVPDEYEHADPFKMPLMEFGFSEEELNRKIKQTQEKVYDHTSGKTPVHLSAFGALQEDLTEGWYGLIYPIQRVISPRSAAKIMATKKREALHKVWYKDLTAIQINDNPDLIHSVVDNIDRFVFPADKLIPELQQHAAAWIRMMGGDIKVMERRISRLMAACVGNDPQNIGATAIELIFRKAGELAPTPLKLLKAVSQVPALGQGVNFLAGQAVQDLEGMNPRTTVEKLVWDGTKPFRRLLVGKMERDLQSLFD